MFTKVALFIAAGLAITSIATPTPERRQALAQVITKCTVPNTVALTFDDGPYLWTKNVSDALTAVGAVGTFFVNGNNWDCIYDPDVQARLQYAYLHGNQIASHTWNHWNLTTLTWDQIHDQMWRVELAMSRILGAVPAFMRPPYGSYNNLVRQASYIRKQKMVIWDFDSLDSDGATPAESKSRYDAIVAQHPSTILALNHETYETTVVEVLPHAISKLRSAGYKLVTVAECLGLPAYQSVGPRGTPDASWTC